VKSLGILAAACFIALPVAAQPIQPVQQSADAERSVLARHYLELAKPDWLNGNFEIEHTLAFYGMSRTLEEANLFIRHKPPASSPIASIVYGQLKSSFEQSTRHATPALSESLVAVYARMLSVEELRALIAFEEQPSQRAAEAASDQVDARMQAQFDAEGAWWDEELRTGKIKLPEAPSPLAGLEKLIPPDTEPAPGTSPTWDAIFAKRTAVYRTAYSELNRLWPDVAAAAQVDYCAHVHCSATDRQILTGLGAVFADPNNTIT
jgi:hypothetical protein